MTTVESNGVMALGWRAPALVSGARVVAIAGGLGLWYWTQGLISRRRLLGPFIVQAGPICDGIHVLTAPLNRWLNANSRAADALLIISSLVIDLLGFFLIGSAILGPTIGPFLGLLMLFALRQFCQAFCPLPPPSGMIWRDPGVPTLLVTYGTSNDLFFSGHTAIAVYGAATLAGALGPIGVVLGCLIAGFEIIAVLMLRAHYTVDVFTGVLAALYVHRLAIDWAPTIDAWIGRVLYHGG